MRFGGHFKFITHFNTLHHNPFLLSFDSVSLIISMIRIMSFSLSYLPVYPLQLFAGMKTLSRIQFQMIVEKEDEA